MAGKPLVVDFGLLSEAVDGLARRGHGRASITAIVVSEAVTDLDLLSEVFDHLGIAPEPARPTAGDEPVSGLAALLRAVIGTHDQNPEMGVA